MKGVGQRSFAFSMLLLITSISYYVCSLYQYEAWDMRGALIRDEINSVIRYVFTNGNPAYLGSLVLVRVDEAELPVYAGFRLSAERIALSDLHVLTDNCQRLIGD